MKQRALSGGQGQLPLEELDHLGQRPRVSEHAVDVEDAQVREVYFTYDGAQIVIVKSNGTVEVWDVGDLET